MAIVKTIPITNAERDELEELNAVKIARENLAIHGLDRSKDTDRAKPLLAERAKAWRAFSTAYSRLIKKYVSEEERRYSNSVDFQECAIILADTEAAELHEHEITRDESLYLERLFEERVSALTYVSQFVENDRFGITEDEFGAACDEFVTCEFSYLAAFSQLCAQHIPLEERIARQFRFYFTTNKFVPAE